MAGKKSQLYSLRFGVPVNSTHNLVKLGYGFESPSPSSNFDNIQGASV